MWVKSDFEISDQYFEDLTKVFDRDYLINNISYYCSNNGPIIRLYNDRDNIFYAFDNNEIIRYHVSELFVYTSHSFGGTSFNFSFTMNYHINGKYRFFNISRSLDGLCNKIITYYSSEIEYYRKWNFHKETKKISNRLDKFKYKLANNDIIDIVIDGNHVWRFK